MAIGLFHTRLNVRNGLLGAPTLTLDLLVNTVQKKITGTARIAQSTLPVVQFHADVWGSYSELPFAPGGSPSIVLHLDGSPSGPLSQIAQTFHLQGLVDSGWNQGSATYRYFINGHWLDQHGAVRKAPDITHQQEPGERLKSALHQLQSA